MIREQLLFFIYDHERAAIKFSYVIFLHENLIQTRIKKASASRDGDCV